MATKVALTAEEFRENSQRSIDLFNTEKLSTDSTHVLKSVYYNSVHFCSCNLHGACGGKERVFDGNQHIALLQSARSVWRQSEGSIAYSPPFGLQSARSVWRQSGKGRAKRRGAGGLQSARSVWRQSEGSIAYSPPFGLQSARSVWRQRRRMLSFWTARNVAICTERVEAKLLVSLFSIPLVVAICTGRVEDLASSPEKNPRKFMQTYCIFIHLGV